ncbi:MAG TPA: potassium transporter Kup [Gemmatimonadaceae bacterium]|jgi:KUP system potassium uptake protein
MTAEPLRKGGASAATEASPAAATEASTSATPKEPPSGASGFFAAVRPHRQSLEARPSGRRLAGLSLIALGIVYGDIGTSPLYALRQCFDPEYGLEASRLNVYGVLSLIVWMLIIVVSIKYIVFIMRADNRGEGGILALLALLLQQERRVADRRRRWFLVTLGLFGASLLYGDGIITPAISVLGAVEGVQVVHPHLPETIIVVVALLILLALFVFQRFGTARIGGTFGPLMALWFATIAVLGAAEIAREPRVLFALNPLYGLQFFSANGRTGFLVLGAVVLAVTGAEALYADMGHFGKRPIRLAWFGLVFPALLLNYFGQGALVLRNPAAASNPFFQLAPSALLWPLVVIATVAAVIASQALISGAFSLTQQSVQLGYSPRVTIVHTSHSQVGQIYIPEINNALMVGCLLLVLVFRNSTSLGAAYGIAVTGTMAITSILFYVVARSRWNWSLAHVGSLTAAFLFVDISLFSANAIKFEHGGWVPVAIAIGVFTLMSTWKKGRMMLNEVLHAGSLPLSLFLDDVERRKPPRVAGTAVFMTSSAEGVPVVLLHHLKHNKVLHEQVVLMSILTEEVPEVPDDERVTVERLQQGFYRVTARYGFMETPDVPEVLSIAKAQGLRARALDTTFYLGRERIIIADRSRYGRETSPKPGVRRAPAPSEGAPRPLRLARWRKRLFVVMTRNARSATEFFGIPPNRVVELGAQVEF